MQLNKLFQINFVFLSITTLTVLTISATRTNGQKDVTTSAPPTSTLQRSTTDGYNLESEGLIKRATDSITSSSNTVSAAVRNYDPPPEFYRGPGSTGHFTTTTSPSYHNNNYKPSNGFISKPIAFPDTYNNNKHDNHNNYNAAAVWGGGLQDNSNVHLANSYNTWQHLKDKVGGLLNKKGFTLQDRISVGHYGPSEHVGSSSGSSSGNGGYTYESHPHQHVEYLPVQAHYAGNSPPSVHSAGYYGSSVVAEGIPFDVYGSKNHHYTGGGAGGSEYSSYPSYTDAHEPATHKTHPDISQKALLAKSFLIPLASAAVLGIAAALVSNPLLLQLGTVSGVPPGVAIIGKRKRRALTTNLMQTKKTTKDLYLSSDFYKTYKKETKLLPYRAHHRQYQSLQ